MEVKYLRPHNGNNIGDTENVPDDIGKYLIVPGVAKEIIDKKPKGGHKK